jgi:Zn-dependent alcohol dehydrogenase
MKNLRKYAGAFSRPTTKFGDNITLDHCSFYDHGVQYALSGNVVALVVRGVHAGFGSVYPSSSKSTSSTVEALQRSIGDSQVKHIYSVNADELIAASREMGTPHEASQQGMPETNGLIEREVQDMLAGTRSVMYVTGMPG